MENGKYFKAEAIDYRGQLRKIPKNKNKLQPIFEALTNSIEAIKLSPSQDRGEITIQLKFIKENLISDEVMLSEITFIDNGIGFNDENFLRFRRLHDDSKNFFNHGSGRIQYIHFFETVEFESRYKDVTSNTGIFKRVINLSKSKSFLEQNSIMYYYEPKEDKEKNISTKITFKKLLKEDDQKFYDKLSVQELKKRIIIHYLDYFCENRDTFPLIIIKSFKNNREVDKVEISTIDIAEEDKRDTIEIEYKGFANDGKTLIKSEKTEKFHIKVFKLTEKLLDSNSLKLTSKHEIVEGEITEKIELDILKHDDIINGNRYLFLISSEYIDKKDNDVRGDIELYTEEEFKKDSSLFSDKEVIILDDIQDKVNTHILSMYPEILELRNKHEVDIKKLQEMFLLDKNTLKNIKINMQDTDESILKKVYKADAQKVAEKDAKIKEQIDSLHELNPAHQNYQDELEFKVASLVKDIPLQNKTALTHTVARRKLVLDLFEKTLDNELKIQQTTKRNMDEELLHNIIFQQSSNKANNSDLWLINEDFIYFKGNSEHRLNDIEIDGKKILKEDNELNDEEKEFITSLNENRYSKRTDILLFPSEGKCIIIEFKNPNVNVAKHLDQIDNYASLIWNFSKKEFEFNTFYGYLIGEKIEVKEVRMHRPAFREAYHFDYLFRPNELVAGIFRKGDASLYTEVIKYSTLLKRAKRRNEIFIEKIMD